MSLTCQRHQQRAEDCPACGLVELSKMARHSPVIVECRVCIQPAEPDNPAGLCGADDHDHLVGWRTAQTGMPWPGNAA